ncbi:MAG: 2-oxoglutarate dehydrogenase E1 component [Verrucomicrobiota bacterium]
MSSDKQHEQNGGLPACLNVAFVEALHADYLRDPQSVSAEWREYFQNLGEEGEFARKPQLGPSFPRRSLFNPAGGAAAPAPIEDQEGKLRSLQDRVNQLIRNFRIRGHMIARIDPLDRTRACPDELLEAYFQFKEEDLERAVSCETFQVNRKLTIREIYEKLRNTYCRSIGVQYMHIDDIRIRRWLQRRMEACENRIQLSRAEQIRILTRLTDAVTFEEFIHKKFIGAKSFSLEGCESLIPLLDLAIEKAGEQGVKEIVLGMAHRGRLNVLANIMRKSPRDIFREFADADPEHYTGSGDVKYHLGYSNDWVTSSGRKVHLSLCFNPSHLEFVNSVVLGRTRAKQDRCQDIEHKRGLALLIHGDAAFAGEGVTQETFNLSELSGYRVGGTLHVIVNNQIGFTTPPGEGRSCEYASDVAKMLEIPIFHVNGEDPEAVAQVVRLALDFRAEFQRDVVIDMYGYRRLGHNETDEPSFTQPVLYRAIEKRKPVREGYLDHLLTLGGVTREEADEIDRKRREHLERELSESRSSSYARSKDALRGVWNGYLGGPEPAADDVKTGAAKKRLAELLEKQTHLPADFHPHKKIEKLLENRREMAKGKLPLDWAAGESLAMALLATDGHRVRLSGQDVGRGTFSHRHAILYDYEDGHRYIPLQHLAPDQAPVNVYNSPLSEIGVLGFDYGYSLDCPDGLVMWEAQFGDFVNVAQVIIDQFIASAEDKWRRLSGLVLLLPHGFEGQGPEHSSARLERFLALCAEDNLQVAYPTTPAQYFHLLRRQVLRRWHKPLVVMTPKSLLRHPAVVSSLDEVAEGRFERILPDMAKLKPRDVKRVVLCTGKIYYELAQKRDELKRTDVAILRVEQLYPLHKETLEAALKPYAPETPVMWVQEEPENMGAWRSLWAALGPKVLGTHPLSVVSRPASGSPATGSANSHKLEQQKVLNAAFAGI